MTQYLSHINDSHSQSFVAQNGSILVAFSPLQHDLQSVGIPLQEMGVLKITNIKSDKQCRPHYRITYLSALRWKPTCRLISTHCFCYSIRKLIFIFYFLQINVFFFNPTTDIIKQDCIYSVYFQSANSCYHCPSSALRSRDTHFFLNFLGLNKISDAIYFQSLFSVTDLVDFMASTGACLSVPQITATKCNTDCGQTILSMPSDSSSVSPATHNPLGDLKLPGKILILRHPGL